VKIRPQLCLKKRAACGSINQAAKARGRSPCHHQGLPRHSGRQLKRDVRYEGFSAGFAQ
jgi:hypothetical protein